MSNPENVSKGLIMLVDDDENLLEGMAEVLQFVQYEVISAENGKQALEVLRASSRVPDVIVSDIMMPYMDGFVLLEEVRKEPAWMHIPFLFLTARDDFGRKASLFEYLTKPFDAEDLILTIEGILKQHQKIDD